jgi:hypothetical protein
MNKKECVVNFLMQQSYRQAIYIHNDWCAHNHSDKHIYFIDQLWIESQFPTAVDLYNAIKYKGFEPARLYCWIDANGRYHHGQVLDLIDMDVIAEHLINWGDAGYNFACDIEHALLDGLVTWCLDQVSDRYNEDEVRTKLEECDFDFLMDDWDDILKDVFDVVGVCPNCGSIIYQDNPHEYQYETGKTIFECNHCDRVLD